MKDDSEIIEIKAPNLQMQAVNQQVEVPSAMLVLHSQKQNEKDLARAIEESKFEAGLPYDLDAVMQQEEESIQKAIELSKLEAFDLVRKKSIE